MDAAFARIRFRHRAPARYVACGCRLSQRIENGADVVNGEGYFPGATILHIKANDREPHYAPPQDKWLTEMSEFLSTGLAPPRMRTDEKKRKFSSVKLEFLYDTGHAIPEGERRHMAQMYPER